MASSNNLPLASYLKSIRSALEVALCLQNFASQNIERHNKPEIEVQANKELLLAPVTIAKNSEECCYIESSINSARISLKIKQSDELEIVLVDRFSRFIEQRSEDFDILRRVSVKGYDISFLICNTHIEQLKKRELIDFIIYFLEEINSEISILKLNVNSRARIVAQTFLTQFT